MDSPVVSRQEWRWVLSVGCMALVVVSIPYLAGWWQATPERVFGGCILLIDDCYSYLAKMRQGAGGAWLFHITYTSEPHPGTFFYPFYLALGKIAALLPDGNLTMRMVWVYHGARVIFGLGFLLSVYRFLAAFTARAPVRRLAWLVVACGGGSGWLLAVLGQPNWLGTPPLDFYLPEGFGLLVLYGCPHVAAAQSLLLWGILFLLRAWLPQSTICNPSATLRIGTQYAVLAGLCWLLMGLIVPFYVVVAWAVMGAAWVAWSFRERRVAWREGWLVGGAVFLSAPIVLYSAWVFTADPVYATWSAQNLILSPHPLHFLAAYGAPLILAILAVQDVWRDDGPGWLALTWVGIVPVLVYLPFNLQRRLVEGVQVPLSLLAAWGAARLWGAGKRWLVVALLATMIPTGFFLVAGSSVMMAARPSPVFRDAAELAALDWLAGQVNPDDIALTSYDTGNYLPVRVIARVFVGHGLETVDAVEKEALVTRFFDATTDDAWRRQQLAEYGVDYVFWGPAERALGAVLLDDADFLTAVYSRDGYTIFRVTE